MNDQAAQILRNMGYDPEKVGQDFLEFSRRLEEATKAEQEREISVAVVEMETFRALQYCKTVKEVHDAIDECFGYNDGVLDDLSLPTITITFQRMKNKDFDALPEFEGY